MVGIYEDGYHEGMAFDHVRNDLLERQGDW